jgi:hypothetical protein
MGAFMFARVLICLGLLLPAATSFAQAPSRPQDGVSALVGLIESAIAAGDRDGLVALGAGEQGRASLEEFAALLTTPAATRVVVNERDRVSMEGGAQRVILEIFSERGSEARLGTWRIDVKAGAREMDRWTIAGVTRLSVISGLYRLSLDADTQYDVHNLTVRGPDLTIQMSSGSAFVAGTPGGPTAVVLLGKGQLHFSPADAAEKTQVRIFGGNEALTEDFDAAFLRVSPAEFSVKFDSASLKPREVSQEDMRKATAFFDEYVGRTLQLNLADLSRDRWSLTPPVGDLIAEVRTKKFGTLTYARSGSEAEDVSLFDRKRRKNISVYASEEKLAGRGRFYSEDDLVDYDVLAYDLEVDFAPERFVLSGVARLKLRVRNGGITSLTLRLAESLGVRGVYSPSSAACCTCASSVRTA